MNIETLAEKHLWPAYQHFVRNAGAFSSSWKKTVLIGPGSHMDSLKFVHFLIEVEQSLNAPRKLSTTATSPEPFRTMGSFAEHIQRTLEKEFSS